MPDKVVLLFAAGLRSGDLAKMPHLRGLVASGDEAALAPSFPCLAAPVEACLLTGVGADRHGVVGDWSFDRRRQAVVPCTGRGTGDGPRFGHPAIRDILRDHDPQLASAAVGNGAAPRANWLEAAAQAARRQPDFLYLHVGELAEVAQRAGPDSAELHLALAEVDRTLGELVDVVDRAYGEPAPLWLVAGGFAVSPVESVCFPNRILHQAGLLALRDGDAGVIVDFERSAAFAVVNRQLSHIYVAGGERATIAEIAKLFASEAEIAETLIGDERRRFDLDHEQAGDAILISTADSWQAYPWWSEERHAPASARDAFSPNKLGADPLEWFARDGRTPLDVSLVQGSHGAPARDAAQRSVIFSSEPGVLAGGVLADTDVCDLVLRQFGI